MSIEASAEKNRTSRLKVGKLSHDPKYINALHKNNCKHVLNQMTRGPSTYVVYLKPHAVRLTCFAVALMRPKKTAWLWVRVSNAFCAILNPTA